LHYTDRTAFYRDWYKNGCTFATRFKNGDLIINKIKTYIMAKKVASYELYDDRVLVKPAAAETKTAGGIIIPDTAKEKPQKGTIVAVGPGKYAEQTGNIIPVKQKAGDIVLYGKYAGTEITVEGEDLLMMRSSDILMKVG
jgi:chaperonin GroES